jgi:ATP-dependent protease HslVU (ClpYQ) peptidase subunit
MTCIVALEHQNSIYLGSDSAFSDTQTILSLSNSDKIFSNNNFIFGVCGSLRLAQLLQYDYKPPKQPKKLSDIQFLVSIFCDDLRSYLEEKEHSFGTEENVFYSAVIIGYNKKIYLLDEAYQISRPNYNYICEGSGKQVALGAMHVLMNIEDKPENKINQSLEAAAKHTCFVQPPFHILKMEY